WSPMRAVFGPYVPLLRDAWHARRWSDKLRVWFKAPGWRPADVAARFPEKPFALDAVRRFDPVLTRGQQWTGAAHFMLWVVATLVFLWQADALSFGVDAALSVCVAGGLWITGAVLGATLDLRWAWVMQTVLLAAAVTLFLLT
ncbi:MAG: fatty acid hydroxylase, partial [Burkholderiaceae bacterium]